LLWIAFSSQDRLNDPQACFSDDIADDVTQLHVHFEKRFLHVMDRLCALDH
jgi:hypothetical protein